MHKDRDYVSAKLVCVLHAGRNVVCVYVLVIGWKQLKKLPDYKVDIVVRL